MVTFSDLPILYLEYNEETWSCNQGVGSGATALVKISASASGTKRKTVMSMSLRVAVVGAGSIGREFSLEHFSSKTGTKVVSIVDRDHKVLNMP